MVGISSAAERALGPDPLDVVIIAESTDPAEAPMVLERTSCVNEVLLWPPRGRASSPALWACDCRTQDPPMNSRAVEGENTQVLALGIFAPEAAVVENDLTALNVIAIAKATQAEAVLAAFSGRKPFEIQDIVLATPVIRIGAQNGECFGVDTSKFWMLSIEAT
jgi:hypothetical protein